MERNETLRLVPSNISRVPPCVEEIDPPDAITLQDFSYQTCSPLGFFSGGKA
jgi:hypothetical protein